MNSWGMLLLLLATSCEALKSAIDCEDCNDSGQWWPLFKPSQLISSEFPEHRQLRSNDRSDSFDQTILVSKEIQSSKEQQERKAPTSREAAAAQNHRLEWEHYSDVSRVSSAQVPHNSVESAGGEERSVEQQDVSKSEDGSFYDGSFEPSKDRFSEDFNSAEFEKEFGFSNEQHDTSNSIEFPITDVFGRNKPVATSYAKFSSVFAKPRAIAPQGRDLLHPVVTNNNVPNYVQSQGRTPVSHFRFFNNGLNITEQHVHGGQQRRDPGAFQINHGVNHVRPISRSNVVPPEAQNRQAPYVPTNHPVYKYVKNHGGNVQNHQLHQNQAAARWNPPAVQSRTNSPPSPSAGHVHIQNHESVVRHVVPTKSPFSDNLWKESRKIEKLQPPPPPKVSPTGHSYLIFKKKPTNIFPEYKRINRRQGSNYVYIIRRDKRLN